MQYPFTPFKIDSRFNQQVIYGKHEGLDLNGLGGGNTDCNTPIESISEGVCVHVSQSTANYGNLVVIETIFNGVTYYLRYCHLNVISVRPNDVVKVGTQVGTMGSTGNSTACHLHFDILKQKPAFWRFYTQNVTDWFVDPIWFIENYKLETIDVDKKMFEKLVRNSDIADQTVQYLGLGEKADNISFETVKNSLEARNGKLTSCKNELSTREKDLAIANAEVLNREEQVGRLKVQLTECQEAEKDLRIKIKQAQTKHEEEMVKQMTVQQQLQSKFDEEAKSKGQALIELSVANSRIKSLEESVDSDDRTTVYKLLRVLLERIVGKKE